MELAFANRHFAPKIVNLPVRFIRFFYFTNGTATTPPVALDLPWLPVVVRKHTGGAQDYPRTHEHST